MTTEIKVLVEEVFYDSNFLIKKIGNVYFTTLDNLEENDISDKNEVIIDYEGNYCDARIILKKEHEKFLIKGFECIGNETINVDEEELDLKSAKATIEKIYNELEAKEHE